MGGTVSVVIRRNGIVTPMKRWTNPLPHFVNCLPFIENKDKHFDDYFQAYNDMKADWEACDGKESFTLNMTSVYAPYPAPMAPCSYGIVVIDCDNKVILSSQGYTTFGRIDITRFLPYKKLTKEQEAKRRKLESKCRNDGDLSIFGLLVENGETDTSIEDLHTAQRFKYFECFDRKNRSRMMVPDPGLSLEDIAALYENGSLICCQGVFLDMSPWKIEDHGEGPNAIKNIRKRMEELNFQFSKNDDKEWRRFKKGLCDD